MKRVQLTLDERTMAYLRRLVKCGECASLSHAVRKIVGRLILEEEGRIDHGSEGAQSSHDQGLHETEELWTL
jgi:Arc/MetJ-type ribon-helix-helix transcriptional regulator